MSTLSFLRWENLNTQSEGRLKICRWQNDALSTIAFFAIPFLVIPSIWFEFFFYWFHELLFHEAIVYCPKILLQVLKINSELNFICNFWIIFPHVNQDPFIYTELHLLFFCLVLWYLCISSQIALIFVILHNLVSIHSNVQPICNRNNNFACLYMKKCDGNGGRSNVKALYTAYVLLDQCYL